MADKITSKAGNRIDRLFANRKDPDRIMSIFVTAGFPEIETSDQLITALSDAGTDLIELGMPFSDPLADGPTIQYSSQVAIENGTDLDTTFEIVGQIRENSDVPLVLMGYINPILHYGIERFVENAVKSGVDGLILPDVPPEEADELKAAAEENSLHLIYLVAPNTSDERMQFIDSQSSGFVYCVSVTGVTGARDGESVQQSVKRFIDRVKQNITRNPVLIGFGITTHEDAVQISERVEGFVVGSAVINQIRKNYPNSDWIMKTADFVRSLKSGGSKNTIKTLLYTLSS